VSLKKVAGQRYLYQRGRSFIFRRAVPPYAREQFDGGGEVYVTLNTENLPRARYAVLLEIDRFEAKLAKARGLSAPAGRTLKAPTLAELEEGVRRWFSDRVQHSNVGHHLDNSSHNTVRQHVQELDDYRDAIRSSMLLGGEGVPLATHWVAEALIESNGWTISERTALYNRLLTIVSRGQRELALREVQDLSGAPRKVDDDTFGPEQYRLDAEQQRLREANAPIDLMDLFDGYVSERKPKPSTIRAWRRQMSALIIFLGHRNARNVGQSDLIRWKEHLLTKLTKTGKLLSARTVNDTYLAAVKAVFSWALENMRIDQNPASAVRVRAAKRKRSRESAGLNDDEAAIILRGTFLPPTGKLTAERRFARRWVPWLCAYSGARVNEITQLRRQDITCFEGIWFMTITPEAGTVKTDEPRDVPLHPHIIEHGFIAEIDGKSGPLFYDPRRRRGGSAENPQPKKVGEHLADWVRELGIIDKAVQPNHGWRHRFKTLARRYGMDAETRDIIQGHAPRTEGEGYGDIELKVKYDAIKLLPEYKLF
jgi:integrase